jgi:hypothetical protein
LTSFWKSVCCELDDIENEAKSYKPLYNRPVFMVTRKRQSVASCVLVLMGAVLFAYGVLFRSMGVSPQKDKGSTVLVLSEIALIKETAVGGIERDDSGRLRRTYTGKPAQACPT